MLILIKHEAKKYAYDTKSGAAVPLSSLQHKVAENIELPLPPTCPTALRYQLAKYDSNDVKRAYDFLLSLFEAKIINEEAGNVAYLLLTGEHCIDSPELAKCIIDTVRERTGVSKIELIGENSFSQELKSYL
ncbi:MAG: hypothetical protein IKB23_05455 [Clostridia bacterium]|nr:hypothetical protein [Clostridia bacterium]